MYFMSLVGVLFAIVLAILPLFSTYALFRKWMNLKHSALLALLTGFFVVPFLALLLGAIGIPFSFLLNFILILLVFGAGFLLKGHVTLKNDYNYVIGLFSDFKKNWTKLVLPLVMVLVVILVFYLRFANSNVTNFFEFDPYYYMHTTELVVKQGAVPAYNLDSYFPKLRSNQVPMFVAYMTGGWFVDYSAITGGDFDKNSLIYASNVYPPLVSVLLALSFFLIFSVLGHDLLGLFAAGFSMVQPQLIQKMAAGVNETQPFGMFSTVWSCSLLILAFHYKSLKLGLVAAFSVIITYLASVQSLWPLSAISIFGILFALFSLFSSKDFKKELIIFSIVSVASLFATFLFTFYYGVPFALPSVEILFLIALFLCLASLLLSTKLLWLKQNKALFYGLIGVLIIIFFVSPLFDKVVGFSTSALGVAKTYEPLQKTIAEQASSSPAFLQQVYGNVNPFTAIKVVTLILILFASILLWVKTKWYYGILFFVVFTFPLFFNDSFDNIVKNNFTTLPPTIIDFITSGDVFIYSILSLICLLVISIFDKHEFLPLLLLALLSMPVLFIGLSQVKYIVHASLALIVFAGFGLIILSRFISYIMNEFKWSTVKESSLLKYLSLTAIFFVVILEVNNAFAVSNGLQGAVIYQDWLDAMNFLRTGVTDSYCNQKFGDDCRVLSWWDYGHWTVFFGEKKTVVDPGNRYADYNQEVARAFVDGKDSDMTYVIKKHHVTHIMVDADLIQKWGALVFLSGSCDKTMSPICPEKPDITNWEKGPGTDKYEYGKYFEYLQDTGQNCPGDGITKYRYFKSGFGIPYCFDMQGKTYYVPAKDGSEAFPRSYTELPNIPVGIEGQPPDTYKSIITGYSNTQIINLNPGLSAIAINSSVINSAFTRMFFFKNYPGVKLVYESPNRLIKIFEVQDEHYEKETLDQLKKENGV